MSKLETANKFLKVMEKANYGIVHSADDWSENDVEEFVQEYVNDYAKSLTS